MFPSEIVLLMAVAGSKSSGNQLYNKQMDVISEYVGYLYDSLVKRGYISVNRLIGYRLTPLGGKSLLEFLHNNKNRAEYLIARLQQVGIENVQKIEKPVTVK